VPLVVMLGAIGPGALTPPNSIQFPGTTFFSSAVFSATLGSSGLLLADGTTFAGNSLITTTLLPSAGSSLVAGSDFAVIYATSSVSTVVEPNSFSILMIAFGVLIAVYKNTRRSLIG